MLPGLLDSRSASLQRKMFVWVLVTLMKSDFLQLFDLLKSTGKTIFISGVGPTPACRVSLTEL